MFKTILLLLAFIPFYICADYPDYYAGSMELLYFRPSIDQSFYVLDAILEFPPQGKRYNNQPRFQPAFRIEGVYGFCDVVHALDFRFTYFNEGHTNSRSGPILYDTIGFPGDGAQTPEDNSYTGIARYAEHFRYYGVDALLNHNIFLGCSEKALFFVGLHFAYLNHQENGSSEGSSDDTTAPVIMNRLKRRSHFWGLGPELGFDYRHLIKEGCGSLFLGTNCRAALLASYTWADIRYLSTRTGPAGVHLNNEPLWRVLPAFDIKLGLSYERCLRGLYLTCELGYELIWYHNAVDAITGYDVAFAGNTIDLFSNFNLQGPYLAFKVLF